MIHENTFDKIDFNGAKGLVFLGDKILAYRRDDKTKKFPNCIDMPGGGREGNETPFETFKREVKEEFGINIEREDIHFSHPFQSFDDPSMISFFFVAKPLEFKISDITFGSEGTEWLMMTPDEFVHRPDGIPKQQIRVKNYLEGKPIL